MKESCVKSDKTNIVYLDQIYQPFRLPKNLERGKGPSASLSALLECFDLDLELFLFSFFLLLDLFASLSSSSVLDVSDELELESDDLRECYNQAKC